MTSLDANLSDKHPLAVELSTLRATLDKYKAELHHSALKLQRHVYSTSTSQDRIAALTKENQLLGAELDILRKHSLEITGFSFPTLEYPELSPSSQQLLAIVQNLTRALSYAEHHQNTAIINSERAYELASRSRAAEEAAKERERSVEEGWRKEREEKKLMELVVGEYAALVRSMDGHRSATTISSLDIHDAKKNGGITTSSTSAFSKLVDSLAVGKMGISRLFLDFSSEVARLEKTLAVTRQERDFLQSQLAAEQAGSEATLNELAACRLEVAKVKVEAEVRRDSVEQYMKFSQSTLSALQETLSALTTRHTATFMTLSSQLSLLKAELEAGKSREARLRHAFDEMSADLARESSGRRTEIKIRIASMVEEDRSETRHGGSVEDDQLGRLIAAESAVTMLVGELEQEMERRIELERIIALEGGIVQNSTEEVKQNACKEIQDERSSPSLLPNIDEIPLETGRVMSVAAIAPELDIGHPASVSLHSPALPSPPSPFQHIFEPLNIIKTRYTELQQTFHEHRTHVQEMRSRLTSKPFQPSSTSYTREHSSVVQFPSSDHSNTPIGLELQFLRLATDRIYDYIEDSLVELEIRLSDGDLRNKGFQAILASVEVLDSHNLQQLQDQITAFIGGEQLVLERLSKKMEDVLHDVDVISAAEKIVQEQKCSSSTSSPSSNHSRSATSLRPTLDAEGKGRLSKVSKGDKIDHIRERTSSMTFGSVMTSSRLRIHRESAGNEGEAMAANRVTLSSVDDAEDRALLQHDALTKLGLRISIPLISVSSKQSRQESWPLRPRQRVASQGIYALGIGARRSNSSLALHETNPLATRPFSQEEGPPQRPDSEPGAGTNTENQDSDIE